MTGTTTDLKKCACGTDRKSPYAIRKNKYSFWGKFALLTGVSVKPIRVAYQCIYCHQIFEETTDSDELSKYVM